MPNRMPERNGRFLARTRLLSNDPVDTRAAVRAGSCRSMEAVVGCDESLRSGGVVPVQSTSSDYNARSASKAARARWAKVKKG